MDLARRKPNRLKDYDYSQNVAYFITICTQNRQHLMGEIVGVGSAHPNDVMNCPKLSLSFYGEIIEKQINQLPNRYPQMQIDKYVIMPNHIHFIIVLNDMNGRADPAPTKVTVSKVMGYFKFQTTKLVNLSTDLWQRSFHDHIIRDEVEYQRIWAYIDSNPFTWQEDKYYS